MYKSNNRIQILVAIMAFLWLAVVVAAYYITHKPFSPEVMMVLFRASWRVIVAFGLISLAGGIGRRIIPLANYNQSSRLAVQGAFGLGILAYAVLIFGSLVGIYPPAVWILLIILVGVFRNEIRAWLLDWQGIREGIREAGLFERVVVALAGVILLSTLVISLAPPLKFDTLVYHLPLPHQYISAGRISYVPELIFWGMPQTTEMLYTLTLTLSDNQAATTLAWNFGVLALVGLWGYVREKLGSRPAFVSLAALLAGFSTASALSWGYVDWLVILFGFSFLIAMYYWRSEGKSSDLILMGFFAGVAVGTKYTAGILWISGIVALIWGRGEDESWWRRLTNSLIFILIVALVFSPWAIKNMIATGNPLYPFLFPAGEMSRLRLQIYQSGIPWGNWQDIIFLPFRATLFGMDMSKGYSAAIGPLLLGFGVAAWLNWSSSSSDQKNMVKNAAAIVIPGLLVWIIAGRSVDYLLQTRLYFAIFPALTVLAASGFHNLDRNVIPRFQMGWVVGVITLFVLGLNAIQIGIAMLRQDALLNVVGVSDDSDHLTHNLGWYYPTMMALNGLPEGSRVMMLWETRSLHCLETCTPDEVLDRWLRERYGDDASNPTRAGDILDSWRQAGYTHLLYHRSGAEFIRHESRLYQPEDWEELDILIDSLEKVDDYGGAYQLYLLEP